MGELFDILSEIIESVIDSIKSLFIIFNSNNNHD